MKRRHSEVDYETYREIMGELLRPIAASGLDTDTLRRLYESKLVYLENLRTKCFVDLNSQTPTHFSSHDQQLIVTAMQQTKAELKQLVLLAILGNLNNRKVS